MSTRLTLINRTRRPLPGLPFESIRRAILGKSYELSLVFVGDRTSRRLNTTYRKKNHTPNVLSFALHAREGELFINPAQVEREAPRFNTSPDRHLARLFIHGCLHLKGLVHGVTMEHKERRLLRRFKLV